MTFNNFYDTFQNPFVTASQKTQKVHAATTILGRLKLRKRPLLSRKRWPWLPELEPVRHFSNGLRSQPLKLHTPNTWQLPKTMLEKYKIFNKNTNISAFFGLLGIPFLSHDHIVFKCIKESNQLYINIFIYIYIERHIELRLNTSAIFWFLSNSFLRFSLWSLVSLKLLGLDRIVFSTGNGCRVWLDRDYMRLSYAFIVWSGPKIQLNSQAIH